MKNHVLYRLKGLTQCFNTFKTLRKLFSKAVSRRQSDLVRTRLGFHSFLLATSEPSSTELATKQHYFFAIFILSGPPANECLGSFLINSFELPHPNQHRMSVSGASSKTHSSRLELTKTPNKLLGSSKIINLLISKLSTNLP